MRTFAREIRIALGHHRRLRWIWDIEPTPLFFGVGLGSRGVDPNAKPRVTRRRANILDPIVFAISVNHIYSFSDFVEVSVLGEFAFWGSALGSFVGEASRFRDQMIP